jgi:hypothetical protein
MLALWAEGNFVFAQETNETVGTDTMLKVFGVRLVQVRSQIGDIGQIAELLLAVTACSIMLAFQIARIHAGIVIHDGAAFFLVHIKHIYLGVYSRVNLVHISHIYFVHRPVISRIKIGHDKFTRKSRESRTALTALVGILVVALSTVDAKELPVKSRILGTVFFGLILTQPTGVRVRAGIRRRTVAVVHLMFIDLAHNTGATVKAVIFAAGHLGHFTQRTVEAGAALAVHVLVWCIVRLVPELVVLLHFGRRFAAQDARAEVTTFQVAVGNRSRFELTVLAFVTVATEAGVARATVFDLS